MRALRASSVYVAASFAGRTAAALACWVASLLPLSPSSSLPSAPPAQRSVRLARAWASQGMPLTAGNCSFLQVRHMLSLDHMTTVVMMLTARWQAGALPCCGPHLELPCLDRPRPWLLPSRLLPVAWPPHEWAAPLGSRPPRRQRAAWCPIGVSPPAVAALWTMHCACSEPRPPQS